MAGNIASQTFTDKTLIANLTTLCSNTSNYCVDSKKYVNLIGLQYVLMYYAKTNRSLLVRFLVVPWKETDK